MTSSAFDRDDYVRFLRTMWRVHVPLERRLQQSQLYQGWLPDAKDRVRTDRLLADLSALDEAPPALLPDERLPACASLPGVVGVSYVLEGSTLGGRVLSRSIPEALGLSSGALSYVSGYGIDTAARWRVFELALDGCQLTEAQVSEACSSASALFDLIREELVAASGPPASPAASES